MLYGEAAPKLFETWIPEYAEKVLYLAKQDNKLPSLSVEDMTLGKLKLTFCVFYGKGPVIPFLLVTFVCMLRHKYLFIYIFLYSHFIFHTHTNT